MHSFICTPESSSCQDEGALLVAVATLVTEGRIPGPSPTGSSKNKDFHEGPHCNLITGKNLTQNHRCESTNLLCETFKKNRDIIVKFFKRGIPFYIEVLFSCDCEKLGDCKNSEHAVVLEQWYFSATSNRVTQPPPFNVNQLLSAIRSQLYFSQITAWILTKNVNSSIKSENIKYRLLSNPDDFLAPIAFSLTASKHEFPITNLGNRTCLNISFLSSPRLKETPKFDCSFEKMAKKSTKMDLVDDRMHMSCTVKGKHCCEEVDEECSNKFCQIVKNSKKSKSEHNTDQQKIKCLYDTEEFDKEIKEAKYKFKNECHFSKDLKDKGQLLLDAIERSGQKSFWPKSECDSFYCDMSESDNFSMDKFNCDRTKKLRDLSNIKLKRAQKKLTFGGEEPRNTDFADTLNGNANVDMSKVRRNLGSTTSTVFHSRTGLPLSSSPAPSRKGKTSFDFDSSLNSVSAIKSALYSSSFSTDDESESDGSLVSPCSPEIFTSDTKRAPLTPALFRRKGRPTALLGSFEESVLNGRLEPVSTVHGFTAELGASGAFVPKHIFVPVTTYFYAFGDHDRVSTPYMGHISLGKKGYNVPKVGTVQVTLFNPLGTVVKMFVLPYDLSEMPPNCQTFIRQRSLYMPADSKHDNKESVPKWLRFLIHVRFMSSKSGKIYLHSDIRMIIMRKSDMDTATAHDMDINYELRTFVDMPANPRFSTRK